MIFDTHAHYNDALFTDKENLFNEMCSSVCGIINCGTNYKTSKECLDLAKKHKGFCYAACGVHPSELEDTFDKQKLLDMFTDEDNIAIGEIGLDYHYDFFAKELQKDWLKKQLEISKEINKPVILHDRDSHNDILEILKNFKPSGVLHCFSGSTEMLKEVLDIGLYIGIGGVVTFKNARKTVEVVKALPLERLLLETDAPYLSPEPFRGKLNRSDYIIYVAQKVAEIKDISVKSVLEANIYNASNLFKINIKKSL